jgi:hypothetical protein
MKKIKLNIVGLSYSQTQTGAYALVLGEEEGKRRVPIIIGGFEAQAIAIELENMKPGRPLTHDLFKSLCENFDIDIEEVIIYNLVEGIFYSKLVCVQGDKKVEIDARTSDAVALALKFNAPIYTYEFILSSAGIILEEKEENGPEELHVEESVTQKPETELSIEELQQKLQEAIENENYEEASRLRDEINKRKSREQ